MYNEKEVHTYIQACVKRFPKWLRHMFQNESIRFCIDPLGQIALEFNKELSLRDMKRITKKVAKYLDKNPPSWLETQIH